MPTPTDCTRYLRQAAGLLVSVGAANGNPSLEDALAGFCWYVRDTMGESAFAEAVVGRSRSLVEPTFPVTPQPDGERHEREETPKRSGLRDALTSLREALAGNNRDPAERAGDP